MPLLSQFSKGWLVAIVLLSVNCAGHSYPEGSARSHFSILPVKVLYRAEHCGSIQRSQWISSQDEYAKMIKQLNQFINPVPLPAVEFDRVSLLLISMGQQHSGGYSLGLSEVPLTIETLPLEPSSKQPLSNELTSPKDRRAVLNLEWREPQPGMITTQALTNPCLLIELPRGGFTTITVVDQNDRIRASMHLE